MNGERLASAYGDLMHALFGEIPIDIRLRNVSREHYTKALRQVEVEYDIKQGDEDYLEWVLTLLGRSPIINEDERTDAK